MELRWARMLRHLCGSAQLYVVADRVQLCCSFLLDITDSHPPHFFVQVNYQYRNGTSFPVALRTLYADGGIPRFYRGVLPALFQGPLSRFGDTAANTGILTLLSNLEQTKDLAVGVKTIAASAAAALFRIALMPIDTVKTVGWRLHFI